MRILNLGSGTKTSSHQDVINIDWSIYLRLRKYRISRLLIPMLANRERLDRFNALSDNVLAHDLAKGIPFESETVDAVYHSHFLEHLDRDVARTFLLEVKRVLKPGGIHRIVVPDLEGLCRAYLAHFALCETTLEEASSHDSYVAAIVEQSVRRESRGVSQQEPLRRRLENVLLGDARQRGETHQWMYDRVNLSVLLVSLGYRQPVVQRYNTSLLPGWNSYKLDLAESGDEYKPNSLYVEALK